MRVYYSVDKNELCKKCKSNTIENISEILLKTFSELCNYLYFDCSHISNIRIVEKRNYSGKVNIVKSADKKFTIYFRKDVIEKFFSEDDNEKNYAKSIFIHELYHCKDLIIIWTTIDLKEIEKDSCNINDLYTNVGYHQWSEYYAHYNSAKILPCEARTCEKYSADIFKIFKTFNEEELFFDDNSYTEMLYENIIHPFIKDVVKVIANYNSIKNDKTIQTYNSYFNSDFCEYIDRISKMFSNCLNTYPDWIVSQEAFENLGRELFDFFPKHNNPD